MPYKDPKKRLEAWRRWAATNPEVIKEHNARRIRIGDIYLGRDKSLKDLKQRIKERENGKE